MSSFWNIKYRDGLLDKHGHARTQLGVIMSLYGMEVPEALAMCIEESSERLISRKLAGEGGAPNRGMGAVDARARDEPARRLRVDEELRTGAVRDTKRRTPDSEAA